jgi:hypothetical protein
VKFWPLPLIRNGATNPELDAIFRAYLAQDDLELVSVGEYRAAVKCRLGTMEFWCANRLYAYAQEGTVQNNTGKQFRWSGQGLPSRWACRQMDKFVQQHAMHIEQFTKVDQ